MGGPELPVKLSDTEKKSQQAQEVEAVQGTPQQWNIEMLGCGVGILFFFLAYGLLQEKIMTTPWEEDGPLFKQSAYLVLSNRIVAVAVAASLLWYTGGSFKAVAPFYSYFGISISNTIATFCQYEALKYVSFPTQTLGKCGKTIPVLILGTLLGGKKYGASDYIVCVLITIGCSVFVLTGDIKASGREDSAMGMVMMGGYLFFDGFTSVFQEKLFRGYKMSTFNQMIHVNAWSGLISLIMLLAHNDLMPALQFSQDYPNFFIASVGLSLCSALGQVVIYHTIKKFGALFFAMVMTTRQVFSILLSCIYFRHPLSLGQWAGAATVFGTLYWKALRKKLGGK